MELTKELVQSLFDYEDGHLIRKVTVSANAVAGDKAGYVNNTGYVSVGIKGKYYLAHRLIWMWHHGDLPKNLDHKNGCRTDNRIENLREATDSENAWNRRINANNSSGHKGVFWHKNKKTWEVHVQLFGKLRYFGAYKDLELAELVAVEARNKYHGEFANHG